MKKQNLNTSLAHLVNYFINERWVNPLEEKLNTSLSNKIYHAIQLDTYSKFHRLRMILLAEITNDKKKKIQKFKSKTRQ